MERKTIDKWELICACGYRAIGIQPETAAADFVAHIEANPEYHDMLANVMHFFGM